jgi:DNA-binding NtrC family response regulator
VSSEILIIDDKEKLCQSLVKNFNQLGYKSHYATNGNDGIYTIINNNIDVVLLDIMLGGENGIDILKRILKINNQLPVIMITGYASIDTAVKSIKIGAFDYIKKPLDFDILLNIIDKAVKMYELKKENNKLRERLAETVPQIVTQNPKMIEVCSRVKRLAATNLPILILGENGTGKEVLSDFIHVNSSKNYNKMLKINCAAFPETLLDNELFGHEKGAYTGADSIYQGVFERAHNGTLFLDEIGDMTLAIQAKVLRVLQNGEIRRIGGEETINVDVRFIGSTNKDLEKLMNEKKFRPDLFYRLNTATIKLIPLRERKEDIPLLIKHFLLEYYKTSSKKIEGTNQKVLDTFISYDWPGNIRELKNTINYAATMCINDQITLDDLPSTFLIDKEKESSDIINVREDMERSLIINTLNKTNFNKKRTAEILNYSRKTLYSKLQKYDISTP